MIIVLSYGEAPFPFEDYGIVELDLDLGAYFPQPGLIGCDGKLSRICMEIVFIFRSKHRNFITAGSKIGSYVVMQAILNQGDVVVLHEPSWVSYAEHARLCGCFVEYVGLDKIHYRTKTLTKIQKLCLI